MKSIQFNYFASESDLAIVANTVLEWHPQLLIFQSRGRHDDLKGQPIVDATALVPTSSGEKYLLCAKDDANRIHKTPVDAAISCILTQDNPVVEYSPSAPVGENIVKIGRFYASYGNAVFISGVKALFNRLQRHATKLDDSGLWIFPSAARTKRILRPWGGKDWDNPLLLKND